MNAAVRWATRCNACGTSFRVHEEQLQASDGYVRCGRCDAVFNARSTLFDLDAAPAAAATPAAQPALPAPGEPATRQTAPPFFEQSGAAPEHPQSDREPQDDATSAASPASMHDADAADVEDRTDLGLRPSDLVGPAPDTLTDLPTGEPSEPVWRDAGDAAALADGRSEPDWREPDPARMLELLANERPAAAVEAPSAPATWRSLRERPPRKPESRVALAGLSLLAALLVLALPVHWAWIEREALRARHADLDALLAQKLSLPSRGWRHLDGLQVSASSLRATPQGGAYQLELVVHNRAEHRLAMPWLDLSLSDTKGQAVLRRALDPALLGPSQPLAGGEQRRLQIVFRVDRPTAVSGYEIGLFHP